MADRSNKAFDVACVVGEKTTLIRVKTTTADACKWSAKKDGSIFSDMRSNGDVVALVDLRKGVSQADIYFIPTPVVSQTLKSNHADYISHPKKNGEPRKDTTLRAVYLCGEPKPTDKGWGYDKTWEKYKWAWNQLE